MSHRMLVICDSELAYANNLMEMIVRRKELALEVRVFSGLEKLEIFSQSKEIDFLLIEDVYPMEQRKRICAKKVFVLTGGNGGELDQRETETYKYQSANRILEQIMTVCAEDMNSLFLHYNKGKVPVIGIYSPIDRIGKTTFAMALGKEYAKKKKVLYLNLEAYSGIGERFQSDAYTMADLLYYARQEHSNIGMRLASMVKQADNLHYMEPIPVSMEVQAVKCEEWLQLIGKIKETSVYECIILDLGQSIQGLVELLKECEVIYMPILEEPTARAKLKQYEFSIKTIGEEAIWKKSKQLFLPEEKEIQNYVRKLLEETEGKEEPES